MYSRSARSRALRLAALVAVLALAGCGHGAARFPASPARLVTDDELSTDVMLSLGFRPVGAIGLSSTAWPPALAPYLARAENLGSRTGGSANLDAISGARPDAILGPVSLEHEGWGSQLSATAPTFYYAPGAPGSGWQAAVRAVAAPLHLGGQADAVIAALELRAAAIREQVHGKTVALLRIVAPQSFSTVDDYDPAVTAFEQSLGLRNAQLRPQQYGNRCAARPSPPRACSTNELFAGVLTVMPHLDAVLVETSSASGPAAASFESSPYFRALAAVRAGHLASASSYEDVGPLGVAYLYSALERAFDLTELHGTVEGHGVELTFAPASRRLCWAGLPAGGAELTAARGVHELLPQAEGCSSTTTATISSPRLDGAPLRSGAPKPIIH